MRFDQIREHLARVPFLSPAQGRTLDDFILRHRPQHSPELGFGHGVSSCYIAAALDELGRGHLTSVDLFGAEEWHSPSIEELLERTGLASYVTVARERTSSTWFLKKQIETNSDGTGPGYGEYRIQDDW